MDRHPLDPIALVTGLVTLAGGGVALLHQLGAFRLGPGPVTLIALVVLGVAGAALVLLTGRSTATITPATAAVVPDEVEP